DEAGCGDRRRLGGDRRQLRADPAGRNGGARRRDDHRPTQPAGRDAAARVADVLAQRADAHRAPGSRAGTGARPRRPDHRRDVHRAPGRGAPAGELMGEAIIIGIVIFTLATFLGFELIQRVPPTLHTPLMSGSNAISGITIVGALAVAAGGSDRVATILGIVAVALAMMNVVGGYAVSDRMLAMFRKDGGEA